MQTFTGVRLEHHCFLHRTGSSSACSSTQHLHLRQLHLGTARRCSFTGRQALGLSHRRHCRTVMHTTAVLSTAGVQGAEVCSARLSTQNLLLSTRNLLSTFCCRTLSWSVTARGGNDSRTKRTGGNTGSLMGTAFTTCRQVLAVQAALLLVVSSCFLLGVLQLTCTTLCACLSATG